MYLLLRAVYYVYIFTSPTSLSLSLFFLQYSCFDVLRTKQQLGYAVFCFTVTRENINSFQVLVQSGTYHTATVLNRIDTFLEDSVTSIQDVAGDESKFGDLKTLYRTVLMRKDLTMFGAAARMWTEIQTGREQFDYNAQLVTAMNTINKEQLLQFYQQYLLNHASAKKLVIAVYGRGQSAELEANFDYNINYATLLPSDTHYPRTTS